MSEIDFTPLRDDEWVTRSSTRVNSKYPLQQQQQYQHQHQQYQQQQQHQSLQRYQPNHSAPSYSAKRPSERPRKQAYSSQYEIRQRTHQFSHTTSFGFHTQLNSGFGFNRNTESRTDKLAFESPFTPQDWGNYARQEEMNSRLNNNITRGSGSGRFLPRPPPKEISTIVEPATRFRSSPPISSPATASPSSSVSRPVSNAVSPPTTISRSATLSTPVSSPSRSTSSTDSTRANTLQKLGTKSLYNDYDSDSLPKNQSASSGPSSRPTTPKEPSSFDTLTISNLIDIGSDSEENNTSSQSLVPYGAVSILEKSTKLPCAPSTLADLLDIDFTIGADISVDKSPDITASSGSSNDLWDSFQPTVTAPNKNNDLISLLDSQDYTHISQNQLDLNKPLEPTFKHNVKIETNNGYQDLLGDICNGTSDKIQDRTEEEDNDDDDDDDDDSIDSDDDSNSYSYRDSNSDIDSEDEDGFNGLWYAVDGKIILKLSTLDEIKAELENAGINNYSDADLYNK